MTLESQKSVPIYTYNFPKGNLNTIIKWFILYQFSTKNEIMIAF